MNTMSTITKEKFMEIKEELKVEAKALIDIKVEIKLKKSNAVEKLLVDFSGNFSA